MLMHAYSNRRKGLKCGTQESDQHDTQPHETLQCKRARESKGCKHILTHSCTCVRALPSTYRGVGGEGELPLPIEGQGVGGRLRADGRLGAGEVVQRGVHGLQSARKGGQFSVYKVFYWKVATKVGGARKCHRVHLRIGRNGKNESELRQASCVEKCRAQKRFGRVHKDEFQHTSLLRPTTV